MTKFKYIIIAAISLLFTISSCTKNEDIIRTLEVSEKHLVFNEKFQTKIVNVTADKGVVYTATLEGEGAAWVSATANALEGIVSITVAQNTDLSLRKAFVVVALADGTRNRVIEITQNGNDPILSIIPDEISFEFIGGNFIAQIDSDAKWTVQNDVEWLEVTAHVQSGEMILKTKENFDTFTLSTTLVVTAGTSSKEMVVTQDPAPTILLPYLAVTGVTNPVVKAFEEARHHTFLGLSGGRPSVATTKSRLMPKITYTISGSRTSVVVCDVVIDEMPDFFESGEDKGRMHDFLLENDFEYLFPGNEYGSNLPAEAYWRDLGPTSNYHFIAYVNKAKSYVRYNAANHKPDDLLTPTFVTFPYPTLDWNTSMADIKTWESTNGGTLLENDADGLVYLVSGDTYYKRFYIFDNGKLNNIIYVFKDYKKVALKEAFGELGTFAPKFLFNPQLMTLMTSIDFVKEQENGAIVTFKNEPKGLMVNTGIANEAPDGPFYGILSFTPIVPSLP